MDRASAIRIRTIAVYVAAALIFTITLSGCMADRWNAVRSREASRLSNTVISSVSLQPSWKIPVSGPIAVLAYNGQQICVDTGESIAAYSLSGRMLWRSNLRSANPILCVRGAIYAIDENKRQLVRLSLATGLVTWRSEVIPISDAVGPMLLLGSRIIMVDDSITIVNTVTGTVRSIKWIEQHIQGDGAFVSGGLLIAGVLATGGNITSNVEGIDLNDGSQRWVSPTEKQFWRAPERVVIENESDGSPFYAYTPANLTVLSSLDGRILSRFSFAPNKPRKNPESSSPGSLPIFVSWPYANIVSDGTLFHYILTEHVAAVRPTEIPNVEVIVAQLNSGGIVVPAVGTIRLLLTKRESLKRFDVATHSTVTLFPQPLLSSTDGIDVFSGSLGSIVVSEASLWAGSFTASCPDALSAVRTARAIIVACQSGTKRFLALYSVK